MKLIPNYNNYYITRDGNVVNIKSGLTLKTFKSNVGYRICQLYGNKKRHSFTIARLLAITYIPNPDNKGTIDHINRDRTDDRIENLRWATELEQCQNKSLMSSNTSGVKNINKMKHRWVYSRMIQGNIYRKSHTDKIKTCFEQYIHSRLIRGAIN